MPECEHLVPGAGAIGIGLLIAFMAAKHGRNARLISTHPLSPCGAMQEGLVQTTGRAAGAATILSPVLGIPCLISEAHIEYFDKTSNKKKWKTIARLSESVPFHIEDNSGSVWVDPSEAQFSLATDLEFATGKKWKPKPGQLLRYGEAEISGKLLDGRLRLYYQRWLLEQGGMADLAKKLADAALSTPQEMENTTDAIVREFCSGMDREKSEQTKKYVQQTADHARNKKLRFHEKNVLAGDMISVLGPAFATDPGATHADATDAGAADSANPNTIKIFRVHPDDPFLIGDGSPADSAARLRKEARWKYFGAFVLAGVGIAMIISCLLKS